MERTQRTRGWISWLSAAAIIALPVGVLPLAPWPAAGEEELTPERARERLDAARERLDAKRARESSLSGIVESLVTEHADLNRKLITTADRIQDLETRLTALEDRLSELSEQEGVIRDSIQQRHGMLVKMLAAIGRIGRQPPPPLVTQRKDALGMVHSAMLLSRLFPELRFQAQTLAHELADLEKLKVAIQKDQETLRSQNAEMDAERNQLAALTARKQELLKSRKRELTDINQQVAEEARTVTDLGELVSKLDGKFAKRAALMMMDAEAAAGAAVVQRERQLAAKTESEAEAAEAAEAAKATAEKVAFISPERMKPALAFAEAKGHLRSPVRGETVRAFGVEGDLGAVSRGLSIATRTGAQVIAPNGGWIAYAGPFRSYGQLLIIDAGEGYHVLLAGMARIDVAVGQFVLAGEPLAVMPSKEGAEQADATQKRPILYVEFRKEGRPIDPAPWWAPRPKKVSEKVRG